MTTTDFPWTLTKRDKPLRILSTSDWHLGNRRVPTVKICDRIRRFLFPKLAETDLLNIGGDIWDTQLSLSNEANEAIALIIDLLRECEKHNVTVRVLQGTYSHDRTQSSVIPIQFQKGHFTNDVQYISKVYLEYIEHLDIKILYLPDDLPYEDSHACLIVVKDLMRQQNWSYVDYVFGHGYFEHMLPPHIPRKPKCMFKVEQFASFVRRYVCMGHIHLSDFTDNVFYNNSFDRLAHGEEAPKGYVYLVDYGDKAELKFIENKDATKFITLDFSSRVKDEDVGRLYLEQLTKLFQPGETGYIRVIHPSVEVRQALSRLTNANYPGLIFRGIRAKDDKSKDDHLLSQKLLDVKEYPVPSREILPQMVHDFLAKVNKNELTIGRIAEILSTL